jgi:hypothetical protein
MGRRGYQSGLTWDDVRAIRAAKMAGEKLESIAARYPVTWSAISYIVRNETWHDPDYHPGVVVICDWCGHKFVTMRAGQRFCKPKHRERWNYAYGAGAHRRGQQRRALERFKRKTRAALRQPDLPLYDRVLPDPTAEDPLERVSLGELQDALRGLTLEDVEAMSDDELAVLRARVARAGWTPSVQRAA